MSLKKSIACPSNQKPRDFSEIEKYKDHQIRRIIIS